MSAASTLGTFITGPGRGLMRLVLSLLLAPISPYNFPTLPPPEPAYDFIVVGSGPAGSVIGGRLAEWGAKVLVLEAGGNAPPETVVPGLMLLTFGSDLDWHIKLEPQTNSQFGFVNNSTYMPLGKVVGGGSTTSGNLYLRGSRHDYDHWAALGNTGWSYEDVLPFFKKSINFPEGDPRYHGREGPIRLIEKPRISEVGRSFLKAGQELGYNIIDENADGEIGFSPLHFTIDEGLRESTPENFLRPHAMSGNLRVLPNALVTRILFNKHKRALGVQYESGKARRSVRARKEVIVCAGAIHSPKLLMLSGVGPEEHLKKMGIPLQVSLPGVGQNLQDHQATFQLTFAAKNGTSFDLDRFFSTQNVKQYLRDRTGSFAAPFGEDGGAWFNLGGSDGPENWPNVQLSLMQLTPGSFSARGAESRTALKREMFEALHGPLQDDEAFLLVPILARPRSSGTVTLRSSRPRDAVAIQGNYLADPEDVALMVKAIRLAQKIAATAAMRDGVGAAYKSKPVPGCTSHPPDSDQYWECFTRHVVTSFWHPTSTCKMAPDSDLMGVVSPTLHVRGTQGLRVADASVFPQITSSNIMAPSIMVGERAADLIRQQWSL